MGLYGHDCMVVGFTTTYAISVSPLKLWVLILLRRGVLDTTLCDKVCQWFAAGQWFSPGSLVSATNSTKNHHDITEILLSGVKHHNPNLSHIHELLHCIVTSDLFLIFGMQEFWLSFFNKYLNSNKLPWLRKKLFSTKHYFIFSYSLN